jgi:Xaa-Pro aminopeptidase
MSREVVRRLQADARQAGMDAVVCLSPENVAYTAGFVVPSQPLMRWRHAATVLTVDGREALVCVDMEETTVRRARPDAEVRVWAEFGGSAMHALAELLRDLGVAEGCIGIELGYLPSSPAPGSGRPPRSSTFSPGCRASPTGRSSMPFSPCAPAAPRWTSPQR